MILTLFLLVGFSILYMSQSTAKADRIYLQIKIARGQLSNKEIEDLSQDTPDPILVSSTNRLYYINTYRSANFISRPLAIAYAKGITL